MTNTTFLSNENQYLQVRLGSNEIVEIGLGARRADERSNSGALMEKNTLHLEF